MNRIIDVPVCPKCQSKALWLVLDEQDPENAITYFLCDQCGHNFRQFEAEYIYEVMNDDE